MGEVVPVMDGLWRPGKSTDSGVYHGLPWKKCHFGLVGLPEAISRMMVVNMNDVYDGQWIMIIEWK